MSKQQRAIEGHISGKKFQRLKAAALAPSAGHSAVDEDEEDLDDEELDQEEEIEAFLGGTTEFMDEEEDMVGGEPPTLQRGAGRGKSGRGTGAGGGAEEKAKKAKRAEPLESTAMQDDDEDEVFWVRGAGAAMPKGVEGKLGSAGGGKPRAKGKKKGRAGVPAAGARVATSES